MATRTKFTGKITRVDSSGSIAIVTMDQASGGLRTAVISPHTEGRAVLMNGVGAMEPDTRVTGRGIPGADAVVATFVERWSSDS